MVEGDETIRVYRDAAHRLTPLDDPMANNEHVAILKKGVAANPGVARTRNVKPKLGRAYLSRAYLRSKGSMWIQFPQASRKVVVSARVPTRIFYIRWNRGPLGPWARLIEVQRGRGLTHDRAICGWEDSNSQKHHSMRRQFRRSESINAARKRAERGVRFPTDDGPLARSKYRRPRREQES